MTDRPILFSGPMVRALLDGSKTQTRRVMRYQPDECASVTVERFHQTVVDRHGEEQPGPEVFGAWWAFGEHGCACPYGQPGDRLWVRETFVQGWPLGDDGCVDQYDADGKEKPMKTFYRATSPDLNWCDGGDDCPIKTPWKPSIHMPRWSSRITLEITGVRVERLQDISRGDAMAEGCPFPNMAQGDDPRAWYAQLWNSINGPGSWDANPWVWVVEFRRQA